MDAVLNWIWQGSVVALGTAAALAIVERSRARDRYLVVWAAMLAVLALPLGYGSVGEPRDAAAAIGDSLGPPPIALPIAWWSSTATLLTLWTVWAAVNLARLARSIAWVRRVKTTATPISAGRQARLSHWDSLRTQGRATTLVASSGIRLAAVVGCGAPVIVIAPAVLDELADDELDRIVIHEWAHVQRRDDLLQLLQACIRVVAGWHPAVWWLNRQIGIEREIACDERAVAATGCAKAYASSLMKLASLPTTPSLIHAELTAIAPTGLRRRIERLVGGEPCRSPRVWRIAAAAGGLVVCLLAANVADVRAFERQRAMALAADVHLVAAGDVMPGAAVGSVAVASTDPTRLAAAPKRSRQGQSRSPVTPVETTRHVSASTAIAVADVTGMSNPESISASRIAASLAASGAPSLSPVATSADVPLWHVAADGGVAVGRQSRGAALATAGYFTRLGKRIAGSF